MEQAIFAAGCFWGVQDYFDKLPGVIRTTVGYTGGKIEHPTYEQVCSHTTGHAEAISISFDPKKTSYKTLCEHFFKMHDPTQFNRQGPDVGDNYRSAIFYTNAIQQEVAKKVRESVQQNFENPIVTQIVPAGPFYPAEDYHQKFTAKTARGACHVHYR